MSVNVVATLTLKVIFIKYDTPCLMMLKHWATWVADMECIMPL
jgi:hypothetical protein